MTILEASDVSVEFRHAGKITRAVDHVSFTVESGETLAIVGESGCGKTTLARAILGLQAYEGTIKVDDQDVRGVSRNQSSKVGMVWQDPNASLDPRWTIQRSVEEPTTLLGISANVPELLERVGLNETFLQRHPHQLSGGQRQRVAIARAIAPSPPLVICDEPTAALDLSVQAQVLNLLKDIQKETGTAYLYISHDLATVRFLADRLAVMYLGQIVEIGPTEAIFESPQHPYTQLLLSSMLSIEKIGQVPEGRGGEAGLRPEQGCLFAKRCPKADNVRCPVEVPQLGPAGEARAACFHIDKSS